MVQGESLTMCAKEKGTILYVGNFQLPDKGASANRVVSNGKIFNQLGYRTVFLGVSKDVAASGVYLLDTDRHMYEEAYPKGNRQWLEHMISVENMETLVNQYGDVKLIVLYNVPYTLLINAKKIFGKKGIKVAYDCTEWTGVTEGSLPKRIAKKLDESFIRNKIQKKADGLIVISALMEESYAGCKNLIKLPPLIDIEDSIWHQTMEKDDIFTFCFAGILDGNKESLDTIMAAYGRLEAAKVRLNIIGVTAEAFCSFYENGAELIKECKNELNFMGRFSHEETIKHVTACDCYIFIRQSDLRNNAGFPTKFSEAFSCGVPIITTDISDIKSYMGKGRGRVLNSVLVDEVESAMRESLSNFTNLYNEGLNDTFHYGNYVDICQKWLEKILI